MEKFDDYRFIKTDEVAFADKKEVYFKIRDPEKVKVFMDRYDVSLDDFVTTDAGEDDTFAGLDFQLSVYENGTSILEFGPLFHNKKEDSFTTVDISLCEVDGLEEYLLAKVK